MRDACEQWGKPKTIRVDNGYPWGSTGNFPTEFSLWLIGLGIDVHWNTPRRPQENGVVERSQGTGKRWSEPKTCCSAGELQEKIGQMDLLQREQYPRPGGKTRMELFPSLKHSGRFYYRDQEAANWSWEAVGDHLADYVADRRVDSSGLISVYDYNYYVGKKHSGQTVYVSLDPMDRQWIVRDERGAEIRTQGAKNLDNKSICELTVTNHRRKT